MKDRLFLLKPFLTERGDGPFFCPACALVEGMLTYYPELRNKIEVTYIEFPKPRNALVHEIGEENQRLPKLILGDSARPIPAGLTTVEANGKSFLSDEIEICRYLGQTYQYGQPEP